MPDPADILIIDDEEAICFAFKRYFEARGHRVAVAATVRDGIRHYLEHRPQVVFLDVRLPDGSGLDALERLRKEDGNACVIVMTAFGSLETVTRAIRGKAFDYLVKPLDLDRANELVQQAAASRAAAAALSAPPPAVERTSGTTLIGRSPLMQEVYKRIGRVAQSDAAVLIRGATGTGKELVARAIHEHSRRAGQPFVPVNCAALPESLVESELFGYVRGAFTGADGDKPGRFEMADGGTLFLDEVGELPLAAQVKLLRFLDEQTVERLGSIRSIRLDVRILAATNRDLARAIDAGLFRADLFYRLAVIQIELPPLAERTEDILPLAEHFLALALARPAMAGAARPAPPISAEAADLLRRHNWPGNVRELRNAMDHAAIVSAGGPIMANHLPEAVRFGRPEARDDPAALGKIIAEYLAAVPLAEGELHRSAIEPIERAVIEQALARAGGNQTAAAARLGLHRNTLRTKLRELGLADDSA